MQISLSVFQVFFGAWSNIELTDIALRTRHDWIYIHLKNCMAKILHFPIVTSLWDVMNAR